MMVSELVEKTKSFNVTVENSGTEEVYNYSFGKKPPEGQTTEVYLTNCLREAELLTQSKIDNAPILAELVE